MSVRLELVDEVAVLSWHRRSRHNALDLGMIAALGDRLADLERRPPRALVLWGEGGDFSAGADLNDVRALAGAGRGEALAYSRRVQALTAAVEAVRAPSVAAIEGVCLGLGLEIALGASLRVAAADARLGLPEMAHALYPAAGGTARLAEQVGEGRARAMMLEARVIAADEAHAIALVERVCAAGEARETALAWARRAAAAGEAPARLLAARRVARGEAFALALAAEREGFADLVTSTAAVSRLDAFLARRRRSGAGVPADDGARARQGRDGPSGREEEA